MLSVPHLKRKFLTLNFFDFLAKMLLEKFCSKSYPNIIGSIFATSCRKVLLDPNPPLGTLLQGDFASFDLGLDEEIERDIMGVAQEEERSDELLLLLRLL